MIQKIKKWLNKTLFVDTCNCIICNAELAFKDGSGLCPKCKASLDYVGDKCCERCGKPMNNEATICLECQNHHRYFERSRSALEYSGEVHKLILNYKFYNKRYLAKYLARYIVDTYHKYDYHCDIIVPVPISRERRRQRRYNQVELLADNLQELGLEVVKSAVIKRENNLPQTKLSGKERRDNVKGVYKVVDKTKFVGKRVLLIDDVLTTGSTASEMSRVLMIAGAVSVEVITVAVTPYKVGEGDNVENFDDYVDFL